jgi:F0F1-type ATP synthase assembly protein I
MVTLITGVIAAVMVVVFLGYYALMIGSIPLWLIIIGVLGIVIADFVQTLRQGENDTGNDE